MDAIILELGAADVEHVKWALYTALAWNPERELPPPGVTLEHPEAVRWHRDWGRPGDLGVIATVDGEVVGAAYCRLFTKEDHSHGYLDDRTPELAVAVREDKRGGGLGERLMTALGDAAVVGGFSRLSLSVDEGNRAVRLYERLGYHEVSRDEDGMRMLIDLDPAGAAGESG